MKIIRIWSLVALLVSQVSQVTFASGIDMAELEKNLKGEGVQGWVHGIVKDRWIFVFTYRNPKDFFDHVELPLLASTDSVLEKLKALKRHDRVLLKGEFEENKAPIKHIVVNEVTVTKPYEHPNAPVDYPHQVDLPKDLEGKTETLARVHAIANEGRVLVLEVGDAIVPVPVEDQDLSLTKDLYRGDKIKLRFKIQKKPKRPTHIVPDSSQGPAVERVERLVDIHGKPAQMEGFLVMFPKSPQILFDIFALQRVDADGVMLEYTLVNFEDPKVFEAIRAKLGAFWKLHEAHAVNGRNMWVNRTVRVRAKGVFNMVSPSQANPQILISNPDAIELESLGGVL